MLRLLDAAGFLDLLHGSPDADAEELLGLWEGFYREKYPELFRKQVEDYKLMGQDWKGIARVRVFPGLATWLPVMEAARERLPRIWERVLKRAAGVLGFRDKVLGVIHVGIGCGAGWATDYEGKPAVLFGLEMIAELGWHTPERLEGLAAHELGHVIHRAWRGEDIEPLEERAAGLLYTEGFAQRLEGLILGRESFHQAPSPEWITRCRKSLPEIAQAYLTRMNGGDVRGFFGSWFDYRGTKYTGYFLGYRFIRRLEGERSLREITHLSRKDIEEAARAFLREAAQGGETR